MAVHDRPAAFEGSDGMSYSVAIETGATGEPDRPFGAYFLFMRWRRIGPQGIEGHLETEFLAFGSTAADARSALGSISLEQTRIELERLIAARTNAEKSPRKWWDAMRDDG